MFKAVAIDDELHCLGALQILLDRYCPEVELVAEFQSALHAIESIKEIRPDIVFLDIEMPGMNGFEMLAHFHEIPFAVIFTTGHEQYAIQAIRLSALDYLLKPIDPDDLISAVSKISSRPYKNIADQFVLLVEQLNQKSAIRQVAVPTKDGFEMILIDDVIACEAQSNYVRLHLKNKKHVIVCRTLKETEEQLKAFDMFVRVHHSFLVNLNEVTRYVRGEGGYLIMRDGSSIDVSRSKKDSLLKRINPSQR